MSPPPRVLYRERQRLRAADLSAEQEFLLGLAGRHHVGPHEWGIVRGLAASVDRVKGLVTVAPGLAIDGYGRELALFQPVQLGIQKPGTKQYVYLYYCERPQGSCGAAPNPRWHDSAEITVSAERWPMPDEEPNLIDARAAGSVPDAPSWPVLLGIIGQDGKPDLSESRFTRLRAASIVSPSGHAVMRVGQENLADEYHLRISGRDAKGAMRDRLAIDRDGNPSFWRNLVVSGCNRSQIFAYFAPGFFIKATQKLTVRQEVRWRAAYEKNAKDEPTVKLIFRGIPGPGKEKIEEELVVESGLTAAKLGAKLKTFSDSSKLVTLTAIENPPGRTVSKEKKQDARADNSTIPAVSDDREQPMQYDGGALIFTAEEESKTQATCGCREDLENESKLPQGLVFQPRLSAPLPPSRDVYTIRLALENQPPAEEFRISGGVFQDGDFKRRFTIGTFPKAADPFQPLLTLRANGSIELPGDQHDPQGNPQTTIEVRGTAEYPPVTPDPRDPLFNSLLKLAFINGVLALSSALLKVTLSELPDFIDKSQPHWSYKISLENLGTEGLIVRSAVERITTEKMALTNSNLPLTPVDSGQTKIVPITHATGDLPEGEKITVEVSVAMLAGRLTVAGSAKSGEIPVYPGPSIEFLNIPDIVPQGASWNLQLRITNNAPKMFRITNFELHSDGTALTVTPSPVGSAVPGSGSFALPDVLVPAASEEISITPLITYQWDGAANPLPPISSPVTVTVDRHLTLTVPKSGNNYKLKLKNSSGKSLVLQTFEYRVFDQSVTAPDLPAFVTVSVNQSLAARGSYEMPISPSGGWSPGKHYKIEIIALKYDRAGRTWTTTDSFDKSIP